MNGDELTAEQTREVDISATSYRLGYMAALADAAAVCERREKLFDARLETENHNPTRKLLVARIGKLADCADAIRALARSAGPTRRAAGAGDERITMKQIIPHGWPCTLAACPPGLFVVGDSLGFKSEYGLDAFVVESGEYWWGGADKKEEVATQIVQPCIVETIADE